MTGSSNEVSSASGVRMVRRRLRPAMVSQSPMADAVLVGGRRRSPVSAAASSDIGGLLLGSAGGAAGQGEEHVVEGGAVHGEGPHRAAPRVDLVEQRPHVRGAPV